MFTIEDIVRATGGTATGTGAMAVEGISTDSRSILPGQLFVPLRGPSFDGHDYIDAALARGVRVFLGEAGCPVTRLPHGVVCVAVRDTLRALGDLAAYYRNRFDIPVIGVTGSNGKTTTKEMLAAILEQTGRGLKTSGNLNNLIGVPQMLFRLTHEDRWAVLEMGMSEPGEIDRLAEMARPHIGIITNAFPAHLESMGSVEAVAAAKGELFRRLPQGGVAVYNADDRLIAAQPSPSGVARLSFGLSGGEVTATAIRAEGSAGQSFILRLPSGELSVKMRAFGLHNVANALAAAAAAVALGITPEMIKSGLEAFSPYDKRFNLQAVAGVTLIDDTYNANPASMEAALVTVRDLKQGARAIAVLGDMLELGSGAEAAHVAIGRIAASCVDFLVVTGSFAALTAEGASSGGLPAGNVVTAGDHAAVVAAVRGLIREGDYVLVKGSRGMKMDLVVEQLRSGLLSQPGEEA